MTDQIPLFPDLDPEPNNDDAYRELLRQSWDESIRIITSRGEIPPWCETDSLLNADELRVMKIIDETGNGYIEGGWQVVDYGDGRARRVSNLTVEAGFNAEANLQAVVNGVIKKGYVVREQTHTESRLHIAEEGRWRLDAIETEEYWDGLQEVSGTTEEGH